MTVAIICEAVSNNLFSQRNGRARNEMREVHITVELPWSVDRAIISRRRFEKKFTLVYPKNTSK